MQETKTRRSRGGSNSNSSQRPSSGGASNKRSKFNNGKKFSSDSRGKRSSGNSRGGNRGGGRKKPSFDPSQFINKNPVELKEEVFVPKNDFTTFGLKEKLVETIHAMGITIPSPIQDGTIPEIMKGRDALGLAETGTGKTAAFLVPLIEKSINDPKQTTLILAPTRELAIQIEDEFRKLARGFKLFSVTCVGGVNIRPQIRSLKRRSHFIIGTPGRVKDLIKQGYLKTQFVTNVVLDEADRMLDMGFIHDMREILSGVPDTRQTLFFSATMNKESENLVHDFLTDPAIISVKKKDVTNSIEQDVVSYEADTKFDTLVDLLEKPEFSRVIIFGQMKYAVERLSKQLKARGISAESIHGNKAHGQRQFSLKKFKDGKAQVLVATDVAARGIHVDDVSHVINYELPTAFEDYVHRIGRTGRGSKRGKALTFVSKRSLK